MSAHELIENDLARRLKSTPPSLVEALDALVKSVAVSQSFMPPTSCTGTSSAQIRNKIESWSG